MDNLPPGVSPAHPHLAGPRECSKCHEEVMVCSCGREFCACSKPHSLQYELAACEWCVLDQASKRISELEGREKAVDEAIYVIQRAAEKLANHGAKQPSAAIAETKPGPQKEGASPTNAVGELLDRLGVLLDNKGESVAYGGPTLGFALPETVLKVFIAEERKRNG